jgi:hypothetical protein
MTTLEARYVDRLKEFQDRRETLRSEITDDPEALKQALEKVDAEEVDYMLLAAPYVKEYTSDAQVQASTSKPAGIMDTFMTVTSKSNRNAVLQKYLLQVEQDSSATMEVAKETDELVCVVCDAAMLLNSRESLLVCPYCATVRPYLGNTQANLTYQEEISQNVVSSFSYKRLNHFSEWLGSIQARASTEIGQDVIDAIRGEFKKNRASQKKDITPAKVRLYMKKLNMNKLYEHAHYVATLISGIPAPTLEPELEVKLKHMFVNIQDPFERAIRGTARKNFLSYSFVLYKFCELLGRDDLLCHFSLLKSSEKLHAQDIIWKAITTELQWQFIPSV